MRKSAMESMHWLHRSEMYSSSTQSKHSLVGIDLISRVSADILMEEVKKINSYALLINKSIYWAHYFDVSEKATVNVNCLNQ